MLNCFSSCSQCSFTAQFESGLMMHRQLHHEQDADWEFKPGIFSVSNLITNGITFSKYSTKYEKYATRSASSV